MSAVNFLARAIAAPWTFVRARLTVGTPPPDSPMRREGLKSAARNAFDLPQGARPGAMALLAGL